MKMSIFAHEDANSATGPDRRCRIDLAHNLFPHLPRDISERIQNNDPCKDCDPGQRVFERLAKW